MTATPDRECHEFFFRVTDKPDVTSQDGTVTICPDGLTVQFQGRDGVRTTRATISGPDRNSDDTLGPDRHAFTVNRERWPEWAAGLVDGCAPEGWEG